MWTSDFNCICTEWMQRWQLGLPPSSPPTSLSIERRTCPLLNSSLLWPHCATGPSTTQYRDDGSILPYHWNKQTHTHTHTHTQLITVPLCLPLFALPVGLAPWHKVCLLVGDRLVSLTNGWRPTIHSSPRWQFLHHPLSFALTPHCLWRIYGVFILNDLPLFGTHTLSHLNIVLKHKCEFDLWYPRHWKDYRINNQPLGNTLSHESVFNRVIN